MVPEVRMVKLNNIKLPYSVYNIWYVLAWPDGLEKVGWLTSFNICSVEAKFLCCCILLTVPVAVWPFYPSLILHSLSWQSRLVHPSFVLSIFLLGNQQIHRSISLAASCLFHPLLFSMRSFLFERNEALHQGCCMKSVDFLGSWN